MNRRRSKRDKARGFPSPDLAGERIRQRLRLVRSIHFDLTNPNLTESTACQRSSCQQSS